MARFDPHHESLSSVGLKNKVVVMTGGTSGIGAATVKLLLSHGAKVVFGDIAPPKDSQGDFLRTNVTKYEDNLALFKFAFEKYGRADHAVIANAGVIEQPGWFQPDGIDSLQQAPAEMVLDVNLRGMLYFAHIAVQYLAAGRDGADKSLTLLSSQGGFKEAPSLFVYQSTKHGVLGLMRSLRSYVPDTFGVRTNAICPSMTTTQMVASIQGGWIDGGNPVNQPEDIGEVVCGVGLVKY
jgi:NAD(P)-dependent dehydrogenase (short-subunit alcohol dehydrogenase family)